jgi:hypothetical protein
MLQTDAIQSWAGKRSACSLVLEMWIGRLNGPSDARFAGRRLKFLKPEQAQCSDVMGGYIDNRSLPDHPRSRAAGSAATGASQRCTAPEDGTGSEGMARQPSQYQSHDCRHEVGRRKFGSGGLRSSRGIPPFTSPMVKSFQSARRNGSTSRACSPR